EILAGLLDAVPANRFVQIRTPMAKAAALPGGALADTEAFSGSDRARVGHHNDCFLASNSDFGTYAAPVDSWQAFVAAETVHLPMGGETCAVSARSECGVALEVLASHHWSYLNSQYHQEVLANWDLQGCAPEISQRLGYRVAVDRVTYASQATAGGHLPIGITLTNHGFAAPYNERPAYLVLTDGQTRYRHRLSAVDPRRWGGGSTSDLAVMLDLPDDIAPGTYSLELWLPDQDPELAEDGRYSVRLANPGAWNAIAGSNVLVDDIVIASAEGPIRIH
ncbi:MAG TPA: DUF4832 domain-containing protein, partial [Kofleriaceae bacterium]|nr:DUF4832 domain-containing protein [Kofleriaceae bacterium]